MAHKASQEIGNHDFRPDRLTLAYAMEAVRLWLAGRIRLNALKHALRHHPAGVCGKHGFIIIDQEAADAYFGGPTSSK